MHFISLIILYISLFVYNKGIYAMDQDPSYLYNHRIFVLQDSGIIKFYYLSLAK